LLLNGKPDRTLQKTIVPEVGKGAGNREEIASRHLARSVLRPFDSALWRWSRFSGDFKAAIEPVE
jgi:hypothetical protein